MPANRSILVVRLLMLMTVVTGLVDAFSYLALGRVFVANMTGNVVFLGFAWAGETSLSAAASLVALAAFLLGALAGGELAARRGGHRGWHLVLGCSASLILLTVALLVAAAAGAPYSGTSRYVLIVVLAVAMGVQNATVRALGVPDATTTVLTLTLTGLAADSRLRAGTNPRVRRRVISVLAMPGGALVGATTVLHTNPAWTLAAATVVMLAVVVTTAITARGTDAETWRDPRP